MDRGCAPMLRFSLWCQMAPQQSAKFRTAFFGQFRTSLRKDSIANYASVWTLFSVFVRGPDVLSNALNVSQFRRQVAPRDSQICGGNFQKRKKSAAELCQILRLATVEILINSTCVMGVRVTISCRYALSLMGRCFCFQLPVQQSAMNPPNNESRFIWVQS